MGQGTKIKLLPIFFSIPKKEGYPDQREGVKEYSLLILGRKPKGLQDV